MVKLPIVVLKSFSNGILHVCRTAQLKKALAPLNLISEQLFYHSDLIVSDEILQEKFGIFIVDRS